MTFEPITLLRNIGQFESVNAGDHVPLSMLSVIQAENGRGKTAIAAILRSLNTGEPELLEERQAYRKFNRPMPLNQTSSAEKWETSEGPVGGGRRLFNPDLREPVALRECPTTR